MALIDLFTRGFVKARRCSRVVSLPAAGSLMRLFRDHLMLAHKPIERCRALVGEECHRLGRCHRHANTSAIDGCRCSQRKRSPLVTLTVSSAASGEVSAHSVASASQSLVDCFRAGLLRATRERVRIGIDRDMCLGPGLGADAAPAAFPGP